MIGPSVPLIHLFGRAFLADWPSRCFRSDLYPLSRNQMRRIKYLPESWNKFYGFNGTNTAIKAQLKPHGINKDPPQHATSTREPRGEKALLILRKTYWRLWSVKVVVLDHKIQYIRVTGKK